jgi:hypothetical protein
MAKQRSPQARVVLHSRSMNWVRDFRLDGSRRFPSKMFPQTKLPGDFFKFQPMHKFPGNQQGRHASIACRARETMCNLLTRMSISQRNGPPRALPPSEWTISKSDRGNATRNRTLEHFCSCCNADIALSHPSRARMRHPNITLSVKMLYKERARGDTATQQRRRRPCKRARAAKKATSGN